MKRRTYSQYCAVARALDRVGERWTLLLVRELLTGPRRFKDLLQGLPGIGTNLLSARLKQLEADGLVRRASLAPPAGSSVYELTGSGRGLDAAIQALGGWGRRFLGAPGRKDAFRPGWAVLAMRFTFRPERARGLDESYEYRVDGEVFYARIRNGSIETGQGPPPGRPDMTLTTDGRTFLGLASGRIEPAAAVRSGSARLEGPLELLKRSADLFALV